MQLDLTPRLEEFCFSGYNYITEGEHLKLNRNKIAIIGDVHLPYQDDEALSRAMKIVKEEKPDTIILNGDLLDFPGLSRYEKHPAHEGNLQSELNLGWSFLSDLRKEHPKAEIFYIEGNHEFRLKSYTIKLAPKLYDFIDIPDQLDLAKLKIKWIGTKEGAAKWTDTFINIDGVHIGHFDRVNQGAGMTVRNLMIQKGGSFVQSHIHRGAVIYHTNIDGVVTFGMEVPCLAKQPHYSGPQNWQQGLGFLDKINNIWRPRVIVF